MTEILKENMPFYSEITKVKRKNILNNFDLCEYFGGQNSIRPKTIIEQEGTTQEYIYWILQGEMFAYKKVPGLYNEDRQIDCHLQNFSNPKNSGN